MVSKWLNNHQVIVGLTVPEVTDLYIVLWDSVVRNGTEKSDHGAQGYYYGENGEHSWYEISKAIGLAMVDLGLSKDDEPTPFSKEELVKYFGSEVQSYMSATVVYMWLTVAYVACRRWGITSEPTPAAEPHTLGRLVGSRSTRRTTCSPASNRRLRHYGSNKCVVREMV